MTTLEDAVKDTATRPSQRPGLEAQADFVRARLMGRLQALKNRKRTLLDPAEELRKHPEIALAAGGSAAVLVGVGVGVLAYRLATRKERARKARWDAWMRLLTHPERAPRPREGFVVGLLEKSASAAVAAAVAALAKHFLQEVMTAPPPPTPLSRRLPAARDPFPSSPPSAPSTASATAASSGVA